VAVPWLRRLFAGRVVVQDKLQLVQRNITTKRAGPIHIWHLEVRAGKMYRYMDVSKLDTHVSFDIFFADNN
jgi:hypothetical protein